MPHMALGGRVCSRRAQWLEAAPAASKVGGALAVRGLDVDGGLLLTTSGPAAEDLFHEFGDDDDVVVRSSAMRVLQS